MKEKLQACIILLLACVGFTAGAFASEGTHRDDTLGITFPKTLGALEYEGVKAYKEPGLGYSVRYQGTDLLKADVYVYDKGFKQISDGITSQTIKDEFQEVINALYLMERMGRYKDVEKTDEGVFAAQASGRSIQYLWARYRYSQSAGEGVEYHGTRISETFLTAMRGVFVKIRFTYKESGGSDGGRTSKAFVEALSIQLQNANSNKEDHNEHWEIQELLPFSTLPLVYQKLRWISSEVEGKLSEILLEKVNIGWGGYSDAILIIETKDSVKIYALGLNREIQESIASKEDFDKFMGELDAMGIWDIKDTPPGQVSVTDHDSFFLSITKGQKSNKIQIYDPYERSIKHQSIIGHINRFARRVR